MKKLLQLKTMLLLCALIVGSGSAWADNYSVTYNYSDLGDMLSGDYLDATSYWKVPETSGNSATIAIPIPYQPTSNITLTFSIACFGTGTNPSSSNTTITAIGTEDGSNWTGSAISTYPSSSTYVNNAKMTISKPVSPTTLAGLTVTMGVNTGVKIFRLKSITVSYEYTVSTDPAISVSTSSLSFDEVEATGSKQMTFTVTPSNLTAGLTLSTTNDLYTVSPTSIAYDATGAQTITVTANPTTVSDNMAGKVIISGGDFAEDTEVTLSTTVVGKEAGLSFSPASVELTNSTEDVEAFTTPLFGKVAGVNASDITFTTTYAGVATVSSAGVISLGGKTGTAIIRASFAGNDVYAEGEATCTITVNPSEAESEPTAIPAYYAKVTSTEELEDGYYLIVNENNKVALNGNLTKDKIDEAGNKISVSITNNKISETEDTRNAEFMIKAVTGGYSIQSKSHQYYLTHTGSKNTLNTNEDAQVNSISFSDGVAIIAVGENYHIKYNSDAGQERFRYYTSEANVQLYKYVPAVYPENVKIYVSEAGLATYASSFDLDYSTDDNLKAYIAVEDEGEIKYTEVTKVPAGTGVLLRALDTAGKNYTVSTTTEETDDMTGNKFVRGNDAAVASGTGPYNYILNVVNNQIGFYRAAEKTVAKNRAYLSTSIGAASARIDIFFDDDTNGIKKIENAASNKENGTFFNLAGQRVAQPSKGLYIVNGRKVIVK